MISDLQVFLSQRPGEVLEMRLEGMKFEEKWYSLEISVSNTGREKRDEKGFE